MVTCIHHAAQAVATGMHGQCGYTSVFNVLSGCTTYMYIWTAIYSNGSALNHAPTDNTIMHGIISGYNTHI